MLKPSRWPKSLQKWRWNDDDDDDDDDAGGGGGGGGGRGRGKMSRGEGESRRRGADVAGTGGEMVTLERAASVSTTRKPMTWHQQGGKTLLTIAYILGFGGRAVGTQANDECFSAMS